MDKVPTPRPADMKRDRARLRNIIDNVEADRTLAAALAAIRELAEILDHVLGSER